jgi:hypothetical protein
MGCMSVEYNICIPSSFTANLTSLIQRTEAVSHLARASAIFRVKNIYIYKDPLTIDPEVTRQVIKLLRYINVPPYLRRDIFPIDRDLSYAGITPPLKTDLHKEWIAVKNLSLPDIRLGLVRERHFDRYIVDVGLDKFVVIKEKVPLGKIVPVELEKVKGKYIWGKVIDIDELYYRGIYPGYNVVRIKRSLIDFLRNYEGLIIGTSKYGKEVWDIYKNIKKDMEEKRRILILFGSYGYGLDKIFEYYGVNSYDLCDYYINVVYKQGVETIRVEEATYIVLGILRFIEKI